MKKYIFLCISIVMLFSCFALTIKSVNANNLNKVENGITQLKTNLGEEKISLNHNNIVYINNNDNNYIIKLNNSSYYNIYFKQKEKVGEELNED